MQEANLPLELAYRVDLLQRRYAECIDEERYPEWPEFFTERCLYKIISRDNHRRGLPFGLMFCDSRGMLRDRIASMRNANIFEPHAYRHALSGAVATRADDGTIQARTSFVVVRIMHDGAQEVFATGAYHDRIVDEDGQLRLKERVVVCDSTRVDALLVIPL